MIRDQICMMYHRMISTVTCLLPLTNVWCSLSIGDVISHALQRLLVLTLSDVSGQQRVDQDRWMLDRVKPMVGREDYAVQLRQTA